MDRANAQNRAGDCPSRLGRQSNSLNFKAEEGSQRGLARLESAGQAQAGAADYHRVENCP